MSAMQADVLSCFVLPLPRVSRSFNSNKEFDRFFCSVFFFFFLYILLSFFLITTVIRIFRLKLRDQKKSLRF
jgi:hypothetical protein